MNTATRAHQRGAAERSEGEEKERPFRRCISLPSLPSRAIPTSAVAIDPSPVLSGLPSVLPQLLPILQLEV